MNIPSTFTVHENALFKEPAFWCGNVAVDGDAWPWSVAPLGSIYIRITAGSVSARIKTTNVPEDADWDTISAS